jgi:hypothetical protein
MISHFTHERLFSNSQLPGWKISFYYKQRLYTGMYHASGEIEWLTEPPHPENKANIESYIHELMLYHVYE